MWTEENVESLPREDNAVERKGSLLFDFSGVGDEGKLRDQLAKQLSAFANSGGGSLILGVDNQGKIDGGISVIIRGRQTTKEWLEDICPQLTEPEIVGFRVLEIRPQNLDSKIGKDKAVYVIEIPDSERAPHQSARDRLYYVRLGSKSQPAPHRLIEDIRNRTKHPRLAIQKACITEASYRGNGESDGHLVLCTEMCIRNSSGIRATTVCLEVLTNTLRGVEGAHAANGTRREGTRTGAVLLELKESFFPNMELGFSVSLTLPALCLPPVPTLRGSLFTIDGQAPEEVAIATTIYADSAPGNHQEFKLFEMDDDRKLREEISRSRIAWVMPVPQRPIYFGRRRRR